MTSICAVIYLDPYQDKADFCEQSELSTLWLLLATPVVTGKPRPRPVFVEAKPVRTSTEILAAVDDR